MGHSTTIALDFQSLHLDTIKKNLKEVTTIAGNMKLPDKVINQLNDLTQSINAMEASTKSLNQTKVDASQFKELTKQFQGLDERVSVLEKIIKTIGEGGDTNPLINKLSEIKETASQTTSALQEMNDAVQQATSPKVQSNNKSLESYQKQLKLVKELQEIITRSGDGKKQIKGILTKDELDAASNAKLLKMITEQNIEAKKAASILRNATKGNIWDESKVKEATIQYEKAYINIEKIYEKYEKLNGEGSLQKVIGKNGNEIDVDKIIEPTETFFTEYRKLLEKQIGLIESKIQEMGTQAAESITDATDQIEKAAEKAQKKVKKKTQTSKAEEQKSNEAGDLEFGDTQYTKNSKQQIKIPLRITEEEYKSLKDRVSTILAEIQEEIKPLEVSVALVSGYKTRKTDELAAQLTKSLEKGIKNKATKEKVEGLIETLQTAFNKELHLNFEVKGSAKATEIVRNVIEKCQEIANKKDSKIFFNVDAKLSDDTLNNIKKQLDSIDWQPIRIDLKKTAKGKDTKDGKALTKEYTPLALIEQAVKRITDAIKNKTDAFQDEVEAVKGGAGAEITYLSPLVEMFTKIKDVLGEISQLSGTLGDIHFTIDGDNLKELVNAAGVVSAITSGNIGQQTVPVINANVNNTVTSNTTKEILDQAEAHEKVNEQLDEEQNQIEDISVELEKESKQVQTLFKQLLKLQGVATETEYLKGEFGEEFLDAQLMAEEFGNELEEISKKYSNLSSFKMDDIIRLDDSGILDLAKRLIDSTKAQEQSTGNALNNLNKMVTTAEKLERPIESQTRNIERQEKIIERASKKGKLASTSLYGDERKLPVTDRVYSSLFQMANVRDTVKDDDSKKIKNQQANKEIANQVLSLIKSYTETGEKTYLENIKKLISSSTMPSAIKTSVRKSIEEIQKAAVQKVDEVASEVKTTEAPKKMKTISMNKGQYRDWYWNNSIFSDKSTFNYNFDKHWDSLVKEGKAKKGGGRSGNGWVIQVQVEDTGVEEVKQDLNKLEKKENEVTEKNIKSLKKKQQIKKQEKDDIKEIIDLSEEEARLAQSGDEWSSSGRLTSDEMKKELAIAKAIAETNNEIVDKKKEQKKTQDEILNISREEERLALSGDQGDFAGYLSSDEMKKELAIANEIASTEDKIINNKKDQKKVQEEILDISQKEEAFKETKDYGSILSSLQERFDTEGWDPKKLQEIHSEVKNIQNEMDVTNEHFAEFGDLAMQTKDALNKMGYGWIEGEWREMPELKEILADQEKSIESNEQSQVQKEVKENLEETSKFAGKTNEELQQCLANEEKWLSKCKDGSDAYNRRKANIEEINALLSSSTVDQNNLSSGNDPISSDAKNKIQDTKQELRDFLDNLPKVSKEIAIAIDSTLDRLTDEVSDGTMTAKQALEELNTEIATKKIVSEQNAIQTELEDTEQKAKNVQETFIHLGSENIDSKKFVPIKNNENTSVNKPSGGFWGATINSADEWAFIAENDLGKSADYLAQQFAFRFKDSANVLVIKSLEDIEKLPRNLSVTDIDGKKATSGKDSHGNILPDWEKISKEYDGIVVKLTEAKDNLYDALYGWDIDSVVVTNPDAIEQVKLETEAIQTDAKAQRELAEAKKEVSKQSNETPDLSKSIPDFKNFEELKDYLDKLDLAILKEEELFELSKKSHVIPFNPDDKDNFQDYLNTLDIVNKEIHKRGYEPDNVLAGTWKKSEQVVNALKEEEKQAKATTQAEKELNEERKQINILSKDGKSLYERWLPIGESVDELSKNKETKRYFNELVDPIYDYGQYGDINSLDEIQAILNSEALNGFPKKIRQAISEWIKTEKEYRSTNSDLDLFTEDPQLKLENLNKRKESFKEEIRLATEQIEQDLKDIQDGHKLMVTSANRIGRYYETEGNFDKGFTLQERVEDLRKTIELRTKQIADIDKELASYDYSADNISNKRNPSDLRKYFEDNNILFDRFEDNNLNKAISDKFVELRQKYTDGLIDEKQAVKELSEEYERLKNQQEEVIKSTVSNKNTSSSQKEISQHNKNWFALLDRYQSSDLRQSLNSLSYSNTHRRDADSLGRLRDAIDKYIQTADENVLTELLNSFKYKGENHNLSKYLKEEARNYISKELEFRKNSPKLDFFSDDYENELKDAEEWVERNKKWLDELKKKREEIHAGTYKGNDNANKDNIDVWIKQKEEDYEKALKRYEEIKILYNKVHQSQDFDNINFIPEDVKQKVKEDSEELVKTAQQATADAQKSNSPSKVAMKLGEYWGIGYAEGIKLHKKDVEDNIRELVNNGTLTAKDLIDSNLEKELRPAATNILESIKQYPEEQLENGFQRIKKKLGEYGNFNLSKKEDKQVLHDWVDQYIKYQNHGGKRYINELTDNKKALEKITKEYEKQTGLKAELIDKERLQNTHQTQAQVKAAKESAKAIKEEGESADKAEKSFKKASNSKKEFKNRNKDVKDSATESAEAILDEAKAAAEAEGAFNGDGLYRNQKGIVGKGAWSYEEDLGYGQTKKYQMYDNLEVSSSIKTDFEKLSNIIYSLDKGILQLRHDIAEMDGRVDTTHAQNQLNEMLTILDEAETRMTTYLNSPDYVPSTGHSQKFSQERNRRLTIESERLAQKAQTSYDKDQLAAIEQNNKRDVQEATRYNKEVLNSYNKLSSSIEDYIRLKIKNSSIGLTDAVEIDKLNSLEKTFYDAASGSEEFSANVKGAADQLQRISEERNTISSFLNDFNEALAGHPNNNNNSILKNLGIEFAEKYAKELPNLERIFNKGRLTENLSSELNEIIVTIREINRNGLDLNTKKGIDDVQKLESLLQDFHSKNKLSEYIKATENQVEKLRLKIANFTEINSGMGNKFKKQFDELFSVLSSDGEKSIETIQELSTAFVALETEVTKAGKLGKGAWRSFKDAITTQTTQFLARYFSLQDMIRYARTAFETIHQLDTALVDLKKTTTMSNSDLEEFYLNSAKIAKQTGVTTQEIISQAAAWSRLGYSSKEAAESMSELSSKFAKISPGTSVEDATDYLVSTMKAFHIDVADVESEIMDSINRIGKLLPKHTVMYGAIGSIAQLITILVKA